MTNASIATVKPWFVVSRILLLLLLVGVLLYLYWMFRCIDGCGPYHNTTSVADLDGDGDLDVVLSNLRHENDTIVWTGLNLWINQNGGKFTARRIETGGSGAVAGDQDGDGDPDLFVIGAGDAYLYTNQGGMQGRQSGDLLVTRRLQPGDDLIYPGGHSRVVFGDLNNDGRLDAFIGTCCGAILQQNDGRQTIFQSTPWVWFNVLDNRGRPLDQVISQSALGDLPMHPALGDLDGDGDLDVFAAVQASKVGGDGPLADRVLLNDGSGSVSDSGQRLALSGDSSGSTAAALGDLDGDGDLDALVGRQDGALVWTNQAGILSGPAEKLFGDPSENVYLADFDGDGDLDALLASTRRAALWWNDGSGGFRDSGQRLRYTEQHGLAVADFNADGLPDVFAAAYADNFRLWLNRDGSLSAARCPVTFPDEK